MSYKRVIKIDGPVMIAQGDADFAMHDVVYIGKEGLLGEVIKIEEDKATIQVYEETSGMKIGDEVYGTSESLSIYLGPGIIGKVFDGIERPLNKIKELSGDFIKRGINIPGVDLEKLWHFMPKAYVGQEVSSGTIIGEVDETKTIKNKIMIPNGISGKIVSIVQEGDYQAKETIAEVEDENGNKVQVSMVQKWPVRIPRPYKNRLIANIPLVTGQRVIDTFFPIAKGGTAAIPGGFGTGKTMLQHQLARWSDADIIIYIGCGERGNEMTQVLEDFPKLQDPKNNQSLMERTILIANTSNMPVAAREASIYTGITIGEYYRDMGYHVAIMADSTSRWAEALREISGRLEEMPAEEGFPSYLPSRLSEFYGRAGMVEANSNQIGSVSIIGAVSPQGSDFSEPVTQNTKRFVHVFWGLDRTLAYSRHYPAVNWIISYSEYIDNLDDWYKENIDEKFMEDRKMMLKLLTEENELLEISRVVGQDVLSDSKKLILEVCRAIRLGFLQQSAVAKEDSSVPLIKQYKMMESILNIYNKSLELIEKGIPISEIKNLNIFEKFLKIKYEVGNDELNKIDDIDKEINKKISTLEKEYKEHI